MAEIAVEAVQTAGEVALEIFRDILNINNDEHAAEEKFTQDFVANARTRFPGYNVMIVHPSFTQNFTQATHQHYELPLTWPRTQGYEIFIFKAGEFWLQGDGGYVNWCFAGTFIRDGNHVTFYGPSPPIPPPPPPPNPLPPPVTDGVYMVKSNKGDQKSSGFAWYSYI